MICEKPLVNERTVCVKRGLDNLVSASYKRQDGKVSFFLNRTSIELHENCRKDYTRDTSIAAFKRKLDTESSLSISPIKTRKSSNSEFDFKHCCFFLWWRSRVGTGKEKKTRNTKKN